MFNINGKFNTITVFSDENNADVTTIDQLKELANQKFLEGTDIKIMPDYHAGRGCVIGTTIKLTDKVVPNLVGVDVGCGVKCIAFKVSNGINLEELDNFIRTSIPHGQDIHPEERFDSMNELLLDTEGNMTFDKKFFIANNLNNNRTVLSMGTLGGGNHFIELAKSDDVYYLLIHTGSRYVGAKVARYHQKVAEERLINITRLETKELIDKLKNEGRHREISSILEERKKELREIIPRKELCYLEGETFNDYIHDMIIAQNYAATNRSVIASLIIQFLRLKNSISIVTMFDTVHNYIDQEDMVLRKGAIKANEGDKIVIPLNMRDGTLLCVGKGNPEWNNSAPHGAGRIMSRTVAKNSINMDDFKESMKGIFTTSVEFDTIDESPFAYKDKDQIIKHIGETVDIVKILKPIYNFKASE